MLVHEKQYLISRAFKGMVGQENPARKNPNDDYKIVPNVHFLK